MNSARGEIELCLAGARFVLAPSFAALLALEAELQTGLVALAKRFIDGQLTLADLQAVIAAGIRGAGGDVPKNLGELIVEEGVANVAQPLTGFLEAALSGNPAKKL
jgi:Phage tail tube protein, GTA-gp10